MTYIDQALTCSDCGAAFSFTVGEQEFHAAKGFTNPPGRCPSCRAARRSQRESGERELFSATCATCGKEARVPFQPRGDKPVYCSDCFRAQRGDSGRAGAGSAARW